MKVKQKLLLVLFSGVLLFCVAGCGNEMTLEENKLEEPKGNCTVTECIKQLEPSNTVEEINQIIGFEATKSEYSEEYSWKLDSKNWITLNSTSGSPILQATIDKETVKNEDITLPSSSILQEKLNNGSFTYPELVDMLNHVEGVLTSKTMSSVAYLWVDNSGITLRATFNNKTGKCSIASLR